MKILHIAAFEGNIGDNASHLGFARILNNLVDSYTLERLDIRKSYNNYLAKDKLRFDENFAKMANKYDLIVFGGGGFLDYWVEGSSNGTTIDVDTSILEKIKSKILITSVGCYPHKAVPPENYIKFKNFLDYVRNSCNITIALRNDGSYHSIENVFGSEYLEGLSEILDHGYFYSPESNCKLPIEGKYIAMNITDDQLDMMGGIEGERDWYYEEIEKIIAFAFNNGLKTVLVPHIHQDVEAIGKVIAKLPKQLIRTSTLISPCIQSDLGTDFSFNIYRGAEYVIASRYHANVCAMKFGKSTIGLSPLPRIRHTHEKVAEKNSYVPIEKGFSIKVISLMENENTPTLDETTLQRKLTETMDFYREYFKIEKNN